MKRKLLLVAAAILFSLSETATAHRLDEYLQATILSIDEAHVQALMRLTPGVAISTFVLSSVDTDANKIISETEERAYAERVIHDLTLTVDGNRLPLRLLSVNFPSSEDVKAGLGEIRIEFRADLRDGGRGDGDSDGGRTLTFENRHQRGISVYLMNAEVPRNQHIRIVSQNRDENQTFYQVNYLQTGSVVASASVPWFWWRDFRLWLGMAILLLAGHAFIWWQRPN
jgi:hypothetical protein